MKKEVQQMNKYLIVHYPKELDEWKRRKAWEEKFLYCLEKTSNNIPKALDMLSEFMYAELADVIKDIVGSYVRSIRINREHANLLSGKDVKVEEIDNKHNRVFVHGNDVEELSERYSHLFIIR